VRSGGGRSSGDATTCGAMTPGGVNLYKYGLSPRHQYNNSHRIHIKHVFSYIMDGEESHQPVGNKTENPMLLNESLQHS
jgi:hypothetical protein